VSTYGKNSQLMNTPRLQLMQIAGVKKWDAQGIWSTTDNSQVDTWGSLIR